MCSVAKHRLHEQPYYQARKLGREWNTTLLRIARETPVDTDGFRIQFDRSPNIFTIPELTSQTFRCGGLFRKNELIGYAIASFQKRYLSPGQLADVMYLGNMHVTESGRRSGFFYRMSDFFFGELSPEADYFYAYIMDQNEPALSLVDRRHPRFPNAPYAKIIGQIAMATILLTYPVRENNKYSIRSATNDDIGSIVRLLQNEYSTRFLAPEMSNEIFLENLDQRPNFGIENYLVTTMNNRIVGVISAWDMTPFKRNRILRYGDMLGLMRGLYDLAAPILGTPALPEEGEAFRDITIAEYAVEDRNPEILKALLEHAYNRFRRRAYHSIIFGASVDDPLLKVADRFFNRQIRSNVILSSKQKHKLDNINEIPLIHADTIQI